MKPLTLEQARHLLRVAEGSSLEGLLTLVFATGMRDGELVALRWDDVDLEKGSVYVHRTASYQGKSRILQGDAKTAASERVIPISYLVCQRLAAHKARQNEERLKAGPTWADHQLMFCKRSMDAFKRETLERYFSPGPPYEIASFAPAEAAMYD